MKAIVHNEYGSPDVLEFKDIDQPAIGENEMLVSVQSSSLNAGDHFSLTGSPWLVRFTVGFPNPKENILGWDLAGRVEQVGKNVTRFAPGDEVYGATSGTLAEYVCVTENEVAPKPANLTFLFGNLQ